MLIRICLYICSWGACSRHTPFLELHEQEVGTVNPYPAKVIYLNFQPLEVVSRYRDPQPQVVQNYSNLHNLRPNLYTF